MADSDRVVPTGVGVKCNVCTATVYPGTDSHESAEFWARSQGWSVLKLANNHVCPACVVRFSAHGAELSSRRSESDGLLPYVLSAQLSAEAETNALARLIGDFFQGAVDYDAAVRVARFAQSLRGEKNGDKRRQEDQ